MMFGKKKKWPVYVTRTNAMGDVLWIEPLVRQLAQDYLRVVVITPYFRLFDNYLLANVVFKEKPGKFDRFFMNRFSPKWLKGKGVINLDMAYENRPQMHVLQAYFEAAGYNNIPLTYSRLYVSEQERSKYSKPYALIHMDPGSISLNFRNAHGINWYEVTAWLKQQGLAPIFISDNEAGEKYGGSSVNPSLRDLISIVSDCTLFIGLDSGPSHLAAAMGKAPIIFFGSVNPWFRHIRNSFTGIIIQHDCEYAGCYHEVVHVNGQVCRLVGREGIPKCCHFSTGEVIEALAKTLENKKVAHS